jgi:hypothetical protein
MGVRYDLHQVGADVAEAIDIVPQPSGLLRVEARQVSPEVNERLIALLGDREGVRIEFQLPGAAVPGPGRDADDPSGGKFERPVRAPRRIRAWRRSSKVRKRRRTIRRPCWRQATLSWHTFMLDGNWLDAGRRTGRRFFR